MANNHHPYPPPATTAPVAHYHQVTTPSLSPSLYHPPPATTAPVVPVAHPYNQPPYPHHQPPDPHLPPPHNYPLQPPSSSSPHFFSPNHLIPHPSLFSPSPSSHTFSVQQNPLIPSPTFNPILLSPPPVPSASSSTTTTITTTYVVVHHHHHQQPSTLSLVEEEKEDAPPQKKQRSSPQEVKKGDPKTNLCYHFLRGHCNLGDGCAFAHGVNEMRQVTVHPPNYRTLLCTNISGGCTCAFGESCRFLHH